MKKTYIPPASEAFELLLEGLIAASEVTADGKDQRSNKKEQKNVWASDWSSAWE